MKSQAALTSTVTNERNDGHFGTRVSLDSPRTSSPWAVSEGVVSQQLLGSPLPRPRRPNPGTIQRPSSMTSLSESRPLPIVSSSSLNSSAKSFLPAVQPSWITSPQSRPAQRNMGPESSTLAITNPTKRIQNSMLTREIRIPDTAGLPSVDRNDASSQSEAKNIPPPVNRAEKPKIPTKPALTFARSNLETPLLAPETKISPFSTPPSSDESLGPENSMCDQQTQEKHLSNAARIARGEHNQEAPKTLPAQTKQNMNDRVAAAKVHDSDAREYGFNSFADAQSDAPEKRPGLPPRREQDQQPFQETSMRANTIQADARVTSITQLSERNDWKHLNARSVVTTPIPTFQIPPKRALPSLPSQPELSEPNPLTARSRQPKDLTVHPKPIDPSLEGPEPVSYLSKPAVIYPDSANTNRRPPHCKLGMHEVETSYDPRLVEVCGKHICTTGHQTRVWNVITGEIVLNLGQIEKDIRVMSIAFKPGSTTDEEGSRLWLGTNYGDLQEIDISTQAIVQVNSGPHERREVIKIYRHQNSMWTLDDGGRLCVWSGDNTGLPDLQHDAFSHRIPKGHSFSIIVQDDLWLATGRDIRIFRPSAREISSFSVLENPLTQPSAGVVTSGTIVGGQLDKVFFGHADGKVTIYSTINKSCLGIVSISAYKINSLAGAGFHLWAGYSTGMIYVYDTRSQPWTTKKEWLAHSNPVLNIVVDRSSLWKEGVLRVVSLGADQAVRMWDGTLQDDWLGTCFFKANISY